MVQTPVTMPRRENEMGLTEAYLAALPYPSISSIATLPWLPVLALALVVGLERAPN